MYAPSRCIGRGQDQGVRSSTSTGAAQPLNRDTCLGHGGFPTGPLDAVNVALAAVLATPVGFAVLGLVQLASSIIG